MNKRRHFIFLLAMSVELLAAPGAHGPDGQHLTEGSGSHNGALGRQPDGSMIMPMATQATLEIQTQLVQAQDVARTYEFSGVVRPHNRGYSVVQPGNNGQYSASMDGVPLSGTKVIKGEILGYVQYLDTAFELASQNSELLSVRNDIAQSQRDVKRLQELGELASEQELERLETQLKTLTEQEIALQTGVEKPIPLIAPQSGVLLNHGMSNGKWVKAGEVLFEILTPTLRMIEVYTSQQVSTPEFDRASLKEYPDAALSFIGQSPKLNQGLRTLYFEYDAGQSGAVLMLIEEHVTVLVESVDVQRGIVLPASAVVNNSNNLPVVWIKISAERFLPQVIDYQSLANNRVLVTSGLAEDNRVVVNGTSLLNQVR